MGDKREKCFSSKADRPCNINCPSVPWREPPCEALYADMPHRDKLTTHGGNGDRERERERKSGSDDVTTAAIYMYTSFVFDAKSVS